jgi:hypothetical protein
MHHSFRIAVRSPLQHSTAVGDRAIPAHLVYSSFDLLQIAFKTKYARRSGLVALKRNNLASL